MAGVLIRVSMRDGERQRIADGALSFIQTNPADPAIAGFRCATLLRPQAALTTFCLIFADIAPSCLEASFMARLRHLNPVTCAQIGRSLGAAQITRFTIRFGDRIHINCRPNRSQKLDSFKSGANKCPKSA